MIVVTGGTGVLGSSFVKAILNQGGKIVLLGIDKELGEQRAAEINNSGGTAISIYANVLDEAQLIAAREQIIATYGRIDGLVNAAGGNVPEGVLPPTKDVFELNIEGMKKAMVLNLWGTVIPVQVFGPELAKSGSGCPFTNSKRRAFSKVMLAKTAVPRAAAAGRILSSTPRSRIE